MLNKVEIKKVFCLLLAVLLVVFLLTACNNKPKMLYQSSSVQIVRNGNKTAVYDLLADKEYKYITKRVKRSDGVSKSYISVDTDTIKIEILKSAGLRVYDKAESKVLTIQRKCLHNEG